MKKLKIFFIWLLFLSISMRPSLALNNPPCGCDKTSENANCATTSGNNSVITSVGAELHSLATPNIWGWNLQLNYNDYSESEKWMSNIEAHAEKISYDRIFVYPNGKYCVTFKKIGSEWVPYNDANEENVPYSLEEDDNGTTYVYSDDLLYFYEENSHSTTKHTFFHPDNGLSTAGKLQSVSTGSVERQFSYQNGVRETMTDPYGHVITFQYVGDKLTKVIEPNPAYSLTNTWGRVTWIEWTGEMVKRVSVGMPKISDPTTASHPNPGNDGATAPACADYYWRVTELGYTNAGGIDRLHYIVKPQDYDTWDGTPEGASARIEYHQDGKVAEEYTTCASCGGGKGGLRFEYFSNVQNELIDTSGADTPNQPVSQTNVYEITDTGDYILKTIHQFNVNDQTLLTLERTWDTKGLLKHHLLNTVYSPVETIEYETDFTWPAASATPPINTTQPTNHVAFAARKYEFTNNLKTKKLVWDGTLDAYSNRNYVTVAQWEYTGDGRIVSEKHDFLSGSDINETGANFLTTTYLYNSQNRLVATCYPQVTNGIPDSLNMTDYYVADRKTYDSYGRLTETTKVHLSDNENDWDTGANETVLQKTQYYYNSSETNCFELSKVVNDPDGEALTTEYTYSLVNGKYRRTQVVTDPTDTGDTDAELNLVTDYAYEGEAGAWGNITETTEYADSNKVYKTLRTYDNGDRVLTEERQYSSDGGTTCYTTAKTENYYQNGNLLYTKQAAGTPIERATVYKYDYAGRRTQVYENVINLTVSTSGSWTGTFRGNVTQYTYFDGTDRIWKVERKTGWAPSFNVVEFRGYYIDGKIKAITDAMNNTTTYTYYDSSLNGANSDHAKSGFGLLQKVTYADDNYATYSYDIQGRTLFTRQYESDGTTATLVAESEKIYDSLGRIYEGRTYNPGTVNFLTTKTFFNMNGTVAETEDAAGNTTTYGYDTAGRRTSVTDALGNVTYYSLDPAGRAVLLERKQTAGLTNPRREMAITYYDNLGRKTAVVNWGTNTPTGWDWSTMDEPVDWNDSGIPSTPSSASNNQRTQIVYNFASGEKTAYTMMIDPQGKISQTYTDMLGRNIKTKEDAAGIIRTTTYAYDQPVTDESYYYDSVTAWNGDEADQTTKYIKGSSINANLVTKTIYPDGGEVTASYNNDGSLNTKTDLHGWTTTYAYDDLGRATSETVSGTGLAGTTAVGRTYDALGRIETATDNNGAGPDSTVTYSYSWDGTKQSVTETQEISTFSKAITKEADAVNQNMIVTYPNSGRAITISYDDRGRVSSVIDADLSNYVSYTYTGDYVNQKQIGPSIYWGYSTQALDQYDSWGRLQNDNFTGVNNLHLDYTYDSASNILTRTNTAHDAWSQQYQYDGLHRLKQATQGPSGTPNATWTWDDGTTYHMDDVGNWDVFNNNGTTDTRTNNTVNEVTSRSVNGTRIITYDAAGNLATLQETNGTVGWKYTYDYRNRLIEVDKTTDITVSTPTWTAVANYYYDAFNRRIGKNVLDNPTETVYIYTGWQVVEEYENGTLARQYVFGGQYIDEPVCKIEIVPDPDEKQWYMHDVNYNIIALVGSSQTPDELYNYEPYGTVTITDGSYNTRTSTVCNNTLMFQGRRYDGETGLYYYRNRSYSAELGRFLQRDPAGYVDGMGLYMAFQMNPLIYVDPYGKDSTTEILRKAAKKLITLIARARDVIGHAPAVLKYCLHDFKDVCWCMNCVDAIDQLTKRGLPDMTPTLEALSQGDVKKIVGDIESLAADVTSGKLLFDYYLKLAKYMVCHGLDYPAKIPSWAKSAGEKLKKTLPKIRGAKEKGTEVLKKIRKYLPESETDKDNDK